MSDKKTTEQIVDDGEALYIKMTEAAGNPKPSAFAAAVIALVYTAIDMLPGDSKTIFAQSLNNAADRAVVEALRVKNRMH